MSDHRTALLEDIARHHWYQTIDLGDGVSTPGETKDATANKLAMMNLPDDLSGRSVLDIGCNEGFFAFECERRGASPVIAIDKSPAARDKFMLVRDALDSSVDFRFAELFDLPPQELGRFDLVFFLAVFHHLRHPLATLDRVADLTRGTAIMEFVEAVPKKDKHPSALVRKLSRRGHLHMLPTRKFLLEILEQAGFRDVVILGEHRFHKMKEDKDMPGFNEQRVLLRASR
jgi:2-polyprenyl-3-methyl-5-hydroxy-6-metoxy-1,4-benzoquinol methylase